MATETLPTALGSPRIAGASKGVACSTTAAFTALPRGTRLLSMVTRNYSTAVVIGFTLSPWLTVLKTADSLATVTDYSDAAQDGSTATSVVLSSIDTIANGDALYVGSHEPFSGAQLDIDAANATASVLTVKYSKSDGTWADISDTDGTDSGGASMAVDGAVTWTVPTDWETRSIDNGPPIYWTRWEWSAALDSSTTVDSLTAIAQSTAGAELIPGQVWEQAVVVGPGGYAAVRSITDAGTANLIINCSPRHGSRFV